MRVLSSEMQLTFLHDGHRRIAGCCVALIDDDIAAFDRHLFWKGFVEPNAGCEIVPFRIERHDARAH